MLPREPCLSGVYEGKQKDAYVLVMCKNHSRQEEGNLNADMAEFISKIGNCLKEIGNPSIGWNCWWTGDACLPQKWSHSSTKYAS